MPEGPVPVRQDWRETLPVSVLRICCLRSRNHRHLEAPQPFVRGASIDTCQEHENPDCKPRTHRQGRRGLRARRSLRGRPGRSARRGMGPAMPAPEWDWRSRSSMASIGRSRNRGLCAANAQSGFGCGRPSRLRRPPPSTGRRPLAAVATAGRCPRLQPPGVLLIDPDRHAEPLAELFDPCYQSIQAPIQFFPAHGHRAYP